MNKSKGITLVSLVITIIVLIILAGISINLILGQDGIINKAKKAKQNMEYAQIEEQEQLNQLYNQMIGESNRSTSYDGIEKLSEFKKTLADYIESKSVERPETAGDASVYINSFDKVLIKEQNKLTEFKTKVAQAITEMGVETSQEASADIMVNNIKNINHHIYIGTTSSSYVATQTFDCSSITGYENLTIDNFEFITKKISITQIDTYTEVGGYTVDLTSRCSYDASTGILSLTYWGIGYAFTDVALISDIYVKI